LRVTQSRELREGAMALGAGAGPRLTCTNSITPLMNF
jgi:hypothetical protein